MITNALASAALVLLVTASASAQEATPVREATAAGPGETSDNRISFRFSQWRPANPMTGRRSFDGTPAVEFTRFINPDLALVVGIQARSVSGWNQPASVHRMANGQVLTAPGFHFDDGAVASLPLLIRWNPMPGTKGRGAFKPYVASGVVPYLGWGRERDITSPAVTEKYRRAALGVQFGGGLDVQLTRRVVAGVSASYTAMTRGFSRPIGGRTRYSSPEFGVSAGWRFGRR